MDPTTSNANAGEPDSISLPSLFGVVIAALVGALAWTGITWFTNYELGYMAWAIGLLVGFVATKLGGSGVQLASIAAVFTVLSIFMGKYMGTQLAIEREFELMREEEFTVELFEELVEDAEQWETLQPNPTEEQVLEFMLERGYGGYDETTEIQPSEVESFHTYAVPSMEEMLAEEPSFEAWRADAFGVYREELEKDLQPAVIVIEDLNGIDALFVILAVSTAFGMIRNAGRSAPEEESEEEPEQDPS